MAMCLSGRPPQADTFQHPLLSTSFYPSPHLPTTLSPSPPSGSPLSTSPPSTSTPSTQANRHCVRPSSVRLASIRWNWYSPQIWNTIPIDIANEQVNPVRLNKLIVHTELKPRDVPSCTDNTDHNKNGVLCSFQSFMCETTCAYAMLSACFPALMSVCVCLSRASWLPALVSVGVSVSCLASNITHGTYFPALLTNDQNSM